MSSLQEGQHETGVLEHAPGQHYLHLVREVILTYRLFLRQLARESGMQGAQIEVLRQIAVSRDGRSSVSVLARDLGIDPAAVTRLVAELQKLGLVAREVDERDGRRRPVVLTAAGRDRARDLHARLHEREEALFGTLDAASVEIAATVLQTLRSAFDTGHARKASGPAAGVTRSAASKSEG